MRDTALTALAGAMRRQGAGHGEILAALRETNKRCRPPHGENDLARIANSVARYAPEPHRYNLTDAGNGELYADHYADRVRYDHRRGLYFVWDGELWAPDCDGALTRFAVDAARRRGMEAYTEGRT